MRPPRPAAPTYLWVLGNDGSGARGASKGMSFKDVARTFLWRMPGNRCRAAMDRGSFSRGMAGCFSLLLIAATRSCHRIPTQDVGKILRLNDDGSIPKDNPFVGKAGHKPEIFSLGHRTILGLYHPSDDR